MHKRKSENTKAAHFLLFIIKEKCGKIPKKLPILFNTGEFLFIMNNTDNPAYENLHKTALTSPSSSGVYLWRNSEGTVIYVGKAKNLKNRLSSYFSGERQIKTQLLVSSAKTIEYITTSNEYEAFILENNLIKKYSPRYNIQLKDGKSYPSLKLTAENFPRLYKTRLIKKDGAAYFGPYPDSGALDTFIETLYSIYPLRHCNTLKKRTSPCMYYHIGRCKAPCCAKITKETYSEYIEEIKALLEGKGEETVLKIKSEMQKAASMLNFEKAARLRDGLKALAILQNQNIVEDNNDFNDRDYINFSRQGETVSFAVLQIRGGKLMGKDIFPVESLADDDELMEEFVTVYYEKQNQIPPEIYVSQETGLEILSRWLKEKTENNSKVIKINCRQDDKRLSPENRRHAASLNMAALNAKEDLIRRVRERGDMPALIELKKVLGLPKLPERIEGFDIAHIGGKFPVASLISFWRGNPDKKNYRYFRLKTTDGIIDDFASMREAASRRYVRLKNEGKQLPDLILIDGGIGQVNAVAGVLTALELEIPVAGLAKRDEEIWLPQSSEPVKLLKNSDALHLLQRVRDETHRFATSKNQILRTKENTVSSFSKIFGVGKAREKILLKEFGTLENLVSSSVQKIAETLKVHRDAAEKILESSKKLMEEQQKLKSKKDVILKSQFSAGETDSKKTDGFITMLVNQALE